VQLVDRALREQLDPGSTVAMRIVQVGDIHLAAGPPIVLEAGAAARLRKEFPKPPSREEREGLAVLIYATEILGISIPDALDQRADALERERKAAKPAPRRR
jgi:hypothetical protein